MIHMISPKMGSTINVIPPKMGSKFLPTGSNILMNMGSPTNIKMRSPMKISNTLMRMGSLNMNIHFHANSLRSSFEMNTEMLLKDLMISPFPSSLNLHLNSLVRFSLLNLTNKVILVEQGLLRFLNTMLMKLISIGIHSAKKFL